VPDPGPFTGTFDAALQPYATICPIAGCGDLGPIMAFPFGGTQPTGIAVNVLTESYNANWSKPTLDVGQYRLSVKVAVPFPQGTLEFQLGFADLQVVTKKKDPVDAGFVSVVKGSPIPVKFRIETGIIAKVSIGLPRLEHFYPGDQMSIFASVFDLHAVQQGASCVTWSSSTGAVTVTPGSKGALLTAISPGESLISATCGAVSGAVLVSVEEPPA
jgi:hypothetical protein